MEENNNTSQEKTLTFQETLHQYNEELSNSFIKPSHDLLCQLPNHMTDFKRKYVLETATVNVRLMALAFSSLIVSMVSMKVHRSVVGTLRNTVIGYFGMGTFLAPEIFNPFLQFGGNRK